MQDMSAIILIYAQILRFPRPDSFGPKCCCFQLLGVGGENGPSLEELGFWA